jgi:hypothetical protein
MTKVKKNKSNKTSRRAKQPFGIMKQTSRRAKPNMGLSVERVGSFRPHENMLKISDPKSGVIHYFIIPTPYFSLGDDTQLYYSDTGQPFENPTPPIHKKYIKQLRFKDKAPPLLDLTDAKKYIETVNSNLESVYPPGDTKIVLDYDHNLTGEVSTYLYNIRKPYDLKLCLYKNNNCVSSIKLEKIDNELLITSNTIPEFEGRKFNKLLRAISIVIAKQIDTSLQFVVSVPLNIQSLYLLVHYFNATFEAEQLQTEFTNFRSSLAEMSDFVDKNQIELTKQRLKIELTPEIITKSQSNVNDTLRQIASLHSTDRLRLTQSFV